MATRDYLKDIVSPDTFCSDVKLIAEIKPVLNVSPDCLHPASHDGSEWRTLGKYEEKYNLCYLSAC